MQQQYYLQDYRTRSNYLQCHMYKSLISTVIVLSSYAPPVQLSTDGHNIVEICTQLKTEWTCRRGQNVWRGGSGDQTPKEQSRTRLNSPGPDEIVAEYIRAGDNLIK